MNARNDTAEKIEFARKLKSLRAAASLTQAEMARRIGVPLRNYQNYEAGRFYPKSTAVYVQIAKAFDITVDELMGTADGGETKPDAAFAARRQAEEIMAAAGGLFAGAELSEEDKDLVMKAISDAYWKAKMKKNGK